eukprot:SAG31_NODE_5326_length_2609_cov_1.490837_6_plen_66_part_00
MAAIINTLSSAVDFVRRHCSAIYHCASVSATLKSAIAELLQVHCHLAVELATRGFDFSQCVDRSM